MNKSIIKKLLKAYGNKDYPAIAKCYHQDVRFIDPIFGHIKGQNVFSMWKTLINNNNGKLKIKAIEILTTDYLGSAKWIITYKHSKTNRQIVNVITSNFHFKDGLIIKHVDDFDIWKWSKQAFGFSGYLFGWTGYMQQKLHDNALDTLRNFK